MKKNGNLKKNLENKLQFLCFDLKRIENFLLFCKDTLPQPWCQQEEDHSPSWCDGECSEKKLGLIDFKRVHQKHSRPGKNWLFFTKLLQK